MYRCLYLIVAWSCSLVGAWTPIDGSAPIDLLHQTMVMLAEYTRFYHSKVIDHRKSLLHTIQSFQNECTKTPTNWPIWIALCNDVSAIEHSYFYIMKKPLNTFEPVSEGRLHAYVLRYFAEYNNHAKLTKEFIDYYNSLPYTGKIPTGTDDVTPGSCFAPPEA